MTANKQTIERYMDTFSRLDHAEVLACVTDDVEWVIPGHVHLRGKAAFDAEISLGLTADFDRRDSASAPRVSRLAGRPPGA